jgi:Tol biopolymer transport system component
VLRRLAICGLLGGCGFRSSAVPADAPPGDDATDAAGDAAHDGAGDCLRHWLDGTLQVSATEELRDLSTGGDERDPWISSDGKTLYFTSNRAGTDDIFRSTRDGPAQPFVTAMPVVNLNTGLDDNRAALTADQMLLALSRNSGPSMKAQILLAGSANAFDFGSPDLRHLDNVNNSNADQRDPFLSADGLRLYLTLGPQGTQPPHIVVATRSDRNADFASPQPVPNVNDGSTSAAPALSPDERVLVFSSTRGAGGFDLWYTSRPDTNHEFAAPAPIPAVNGGVAEADPMLSADGCELYFSSTRNGADYDLFVAHVTR